MEFDYNFKKESPFLALVEGKFKFSNSKKIEQKELHIIKAGEISVNSGKLAITDPFYLMHKENNPYIVIPKGNYSTYITVSDDSKNFTGEPENVKEAYLSIVIDDNEIKKRISRQEKNVFLKKNPAVDRTTLSLLDLIQDRSDPINSDFDYKGIKSVSKVIGVADLLNIKNSMPYEKKMPWFENFFNYGVEYSWFDLMDNPNHIRMGSANIELPIKSKEPNNLNNIIITYCGRDDFVIPAIIEYSTTSPKKIIAIHLDFGVIPIYNQPPVSIK